MKTLLKLTFGIAFSISALTNAEAITTNMTVTVPATSDIWLAGTDTSINLFGDTILTATPFLVGNLPTTNFQGGTVKFGANGWWSNDGAGQYSGPEGIGAVGTTGITNYGFGLFQGKANSLIGVFTDGSPYTNRIVPATSSVYAGTQAVYTASMNLPFYIGTGTNNSGQQITYTIPTNAKFLYLGMADIAAYNNPGSATVQIYASAQPTINVRKVIYLDSADLSVGINYQIQASTDLLNWTNQGSVFTATNSSWRSTNYWDVANWNQLFFRLQQQ
jgi:hypothetical protein